MVLETVEYPLHPVREAFDPADYLTRYPDVAAGALAPFEHYVRHGWREGRNPTDWFSTADYLALNPDVAEAGLNPFVHYILYGREEGRPLHRSEQVTNLSLDVEMAVKAVFDAPHYRTENPDVIAAGLEPFAHFMQAGWRERRSPTPWFSLSAYLDANPDVPSDTNAFVHYVMIGRAEGRSLGSRPLIVSGNPLAAASYDPIRHAFDTAYYLASNPELGLTAVDAYDHFMESGWRERRDPSAAFSVAKYLQLNPDVEVSGANPFEHYILYGRAEHRSTSQGFDFRNDLLRHAPPFEDHLQMLRRTSPDPAPDSIEAFRDALASRPPGKRLHITVSQDDYTKLFGGIQLCLRLEARAVTEAGIDHLHLFPASTTMVVDVERDQPPIGVLLNGQNLGMFAPVDMVDAIIKAGGPASASFAVHSLIGHAVSDVIGVLEAFGAREGIYWVHDYSSVCDGYTLMRNDVTFCGAPPVDSAACNICIYRPRRRVQVAEHAQLFDKFSMGVLAPSDSALSLWRRSFPKTPAWSAAHPHAVLTPARKRATAPKDRDGPVRIGFLGMPTHHKGWPVFAALVEAFRLDPRYEFHHLARTPAPGAPVIFSEVAPSDDNPEPMSGIVASLGLDIALIWSLWPETFCFTAFEAVAGGALVLTNPGAGNVTSFARDPSKGRVLDSDTALFEMLRSGDLVTLARTARRAGPGKLQYTRMSADFIRADAS